MSGPKRKQIGDFCSKGHKIIGDNVLYVKRKTVEDGINCKICVRASQKANYEKKKNDPHYKARMEAAGRRRDEKKRAERYDKILAIELENGFQGKYTGLKYLNLNKRAQKAWEPLVEAFDKTRSFCFELPHIYVDYPENHPPTAVEAFKMCHGCPMLVECGRFANAFKPAIGVWAGEVWENGWVRK